MSGPPSAASGASFAATVTVCNQGTLASAATTVEVRLSADAVINASDTLAGSAPVGALYAGQCATVNVGGVAPATTAVYNLGAIVDPAGTIVETLETNNTLAGARIGIGSRPDFVVTSVTGPASIATGGAFNASVVVCNQGTAAAPASTVSVRLSTDNVINTSDTQVGTTTVPTLAVGACSTRTVSCTSALAGAYYLGAIADSASVSTELDETNNTLAGAQIGLGSKPDLIVSAVTNPASAALSSSFTTAVTVCNQGTTASAASTVAVRLSADTVINTSDALAGSVAVPTLGAGACTSVNVTSAAGATAGLYYVGALADTGSVVVELNETNNTRVGAVQLGVGNKPNLVVTALTGPAVVAPGAALAATATVCNKGTTASSGGSVEVRLSFDGTITAADYLAGSAALGTLAVGQCAPVSVTGVAAVPQATYTLGAIVDPAGGVAELNEGDNAFAGGTLVVANRPDLVVTAVSGPAIASPGAAITTAVTVCNQGTASSTSVPVEVRLSSDAIITAADSLSGVATVGSLSPAQCATVSVAGTATGAEGTYYLGALVDPGGALAELLETNNAKAGNTITVGNKPDLVVTTVSGPPVSAPGGAVSVSVAVCNQGFAPSSGTSVEVRLSADGSIGPEDMILGSAPLSYLDPGQCTTASVSGNAYGPDGTYALGAVVDPGNNVPELVESNNTRIGNPIVLGYGPDLVVASVSAPPSATPGSLFVASVKVCNQGTSPSSGTSVEVRLSSDTSVGPEDIPVGSAPVGYLDDGECTTVSVNGNAYGPEGAYYVGAVVDPFNNETELIETNNATAGNLIGIGYKPDLVITSVSVPSSVQPGLQFTASVTVCNQGTSPSGGSNVDLRFSTDTSIGAEDMLIGNAPVGFLNAGQCATVSVLGNAYGPDGAYYVGAVVDPNNSVSELIETNNTRASAAMGVGYRPDLVVTAVSVPFSVQPGAQFNAAVTVCNQGTTPSSGAALDLRISTDAIVGTDDMSIGFASVGNLNAGQCSTVNVLGNAYGPDGAYYVGAVVDPFNNVQELIETNNATVSAAMGVGYRPDLVVTSVSAPASAPSGGPFTASVQVCNRGTTPSSNPMVEIRLSTNASIGSEDMTIGSAPAGFLNAGQCATVNVNGGAYGPPGAYYIGAVVDPFNNEIELIETNNATTGNVINVGP